MFRSGTGVEVWIEVGGTGGPGRFGPAHRALEFDGGLWVCWPKKASKVETDLTFDIVQGMGLEAGLVDNKTASVTDVYQGMRFVYRLKDRPGRTGPRSA